MTDDTRSHRPEASPDETFAPERFAYKSRTWNALNEGAPSTIRPDAGARSPSPGMAPETREPLPLPVGSGCRQEAIWSEQLSTAYPFIFIGCAELGAAWAGVVAR